MAIGDSLEMQRMQQEAIQRAREMYLRAHPPSGEEASAQAVPAAAVSAAAAPAQNTQTQAENRTSSAPRNAPGGHGPSGGQGNATQTPGPANRSAAGAVQNRPQPAGSVSPQPNQAALAAPSILNTLMEDKDRTLILMMLILLSGEGQSNELMFALLYLLL